MRYVEPYYAVNERFEPFGDVIQEPEHNTVNRIALFHYVVKCVASFLWIRCSATAVDTIRIARRPVADGTTLWQGFGSVNASKSAIHAYAWCITDSAGRCDDILE